MSPTGQLQSEQARKVRGRTPSPTRVFRGFSVTRGFSRVKHGRRSRSSEMRPRKEAYRASLEQNKGGIQRDQQEVHEQPTKGFSGSGEGTTDEDK